MAWPLIFESRGCGIPECAEDVLLGAVDVVPQRGDDPPPEQGPNALAASRPPLQ